MEEMNEISNVLAQLAFHSSTASSVTGLQQSINTSSLGAAAQQRAAQQRASDNVKSAMLHDIKRLEGFAQTIQLTAQAREAQVRQANEERAALLENARIEIAEMNEIKLNVERLHFPPMNGICTVLGHREAAAQNIQLTHRLRAMELQALSDQQLFASVRKKL